MQPGAHIAPRPPDAAPATAREISRLALLALFCFSAGFTGIPLPMCQAETLRVMTWNLGLEPDVPDVESKLQEAAATLKVLKPDVILLQQVRNWKACMELSEMLKPLQYQVLV